MSVEGTINEGGSFVSKMGQSPLTLVAGMFVIVLVFASVLIRYLVSTFTSMTERAIDKNTDAINALTAKIAYISKMEQIAPDKVLVYIEKGFAK